MNNRKGFRYVPGVVLAGAIAAVALANGGCSAANTLAGAAQGCNEFPGSVASLQAQLDGNTQAFVSASADLKAVVDGIETAVLTSCMNIDKDLGVTDTWTAMAPMPGAAPDAELTEACNKASAAISAVLMGDAGAQITCGLSISGGQCTVDASVQASCDASCTGGASCTPPDVMVACQPGELSGQCSGMCNASATCEGSVMAAANCQGTCSADCQGTCTPGTAPMVECSGTCMGNCTGTCDANSVTGAKCAGVCKGQCDAACMYTPGTPAHCNGSCKGTCTGDCKLDATAMVMCGAMVNCKGGCSVAYTAPKCEGELTPPMCNIDAKCKAGCQGHAEAKASCTPPTVSLECNTMVSGQLQALVTTLQTNLPAIISAVQTQGALAVTAAGHVKDTGSAVVSGLGSASGKALVCATAAAQASVKATASINVSVMASASVSGSAGGPTS
jgi:hypothetical protein